MRRPDTSLVQVRDIKDQGHGPVLEFGPASFAEWITAAKRGEFDHLGGA
jgi:hypothetical protein